MSKIKRASLVPAGSVRMNQKGTGSCFVLIPITAMKYLTY